MQNLSKFVCSGAGKTPISDNGSSQQVLCRLREFAAVPLHNLASHKHLILKPSRSKYSAVLAGAALQTILFLLVFMGPFASFPAKRLPQVQAVCDYLVWARDSESDVWLRDDYQIALLTCVHAADGSVFPAVQATYDYLGIHPDAVWPAILARRIAYGYPLETIPTSLPPKKPVTGVEIGGAVPASAVMARFGRPEDAEFESRGSATSAPEFGVSPAYSISGESEPLHLFPEKKEA